LECNNKERLTTWLRWWDEAGNLLLTGDERAVQAAAIADQQREISDQQKVIATQERQQKEQECQQKEKPANYLKSIGIAPDAI
jgi:hypothetical protein